MPAPLFANKPERCPYGHSLAPGMPQKISWLPCICDPAREAAERGRGMGHVTLWCGTCSDQDHRDTRFYEPPHHVGHNRPLSGWATRPDVLALRTRQPGRRPGPRIDRAGLIMLRMPRSPTSHAAALGQSLRPGRHSRSMAIVSASVGVHGPPGCNPREPASWWTVPPPRDPGRALANVLRPACCGTMRYRLVLRGSRPGGGGSGVMPRAAFLAPRACCQ
jgi:hypothetical protein